MLANTKKILITSEKQEIFFLSESKESAISGMCQMCEQEVEFFTFNSAVTFSGLGGKNLINLLVSRKIHYIETLNRQLLICGESLRKRMSV
jgi:hypothetical protein